MKKTNLVYITSLLFVLLLLSGCQSKWKQPIDDIEIVYNPPGLERLGFIKANGENHQIRDFGEKFLNPAWSSDGLILYGLSGGPAAYPAYWDINKGRYRVCDRNLTHFFQIQGSGNTDNPYEVIVQNTWQIQIYDLIDCKLIKTLVDFNDTPGDLAIAGFSYSPFTNKLAYGLVINPYEDREYSIVILDLSSDEKVKIAVGINPTWSLDGTKLAYIGLDGLYTINSDGTEKRQLVNQPMFDAFAGGSPWLMTPIPRWSPDGQWIVYHVCITRICLTTEEEEIYKVQTLNGLSEKIMTGGMYPSWRP